MDHSGTDFLEILGVKFLDDGIEDMFDMISGVNDKLLADININYDGGVSPQFSVDRLAATNSEELYKSDDGYARIFLQDAADSYRLIASTMTFGALRDGDSLSMKPYLMAEMVDFLLGISTITEIKEAFGQTVNVESIAYPNPATDFTSIKFELEENSDVSLKIYDELGGLVQLFDIDNLSSGNQVLNWDLKNANGARVNSGLYYYHLSIDGQSNSSGKILVQ